MDDIPVLILEMKERSEISTEYLIDPVTFKDFVKHTTLSINTLYEQIEKENAIIMEIIDTL